VKQQVVRRAIAVLGVVAMVAWVATGCMAGVVLDPKGPASPTNGLTTTKPPQPAGDLFTQPVYWEPCDVADGAECATIYAPLDWAQPDSGDLIELALARIPALVPDQRVGSLLFNPGGPGASAIGFLDYLYGQIGEPVAAAFDIVAFDPRGVGASTAVSCFQTTEELDNFFGASFPDTPAGTDQMTALVESFAQACKENTGPALAHVDTGSAARDMNLIRAVLGDGQLYYLGYSYGSELGATFAGLFPDKVGRLVLDGASDPSLSASDHSLAQAKGFQRALEAYVDHCLADVDCPLDGPADRALEQINELLVSILEEPLPGDSDRDLTLPLALNGLLVTMYQDEAWDMLTWALDEAFDGDGWVLLALSDMYLDREDGVYINNAMEAFMAIGCLDSRSPTDEASVEAQAQALVEASPVFGEFWASGVDVCSVWPYPQVGDPQAASAPGAAPIVVIGTTGDPATPYEGTVALSQQLESAVLVTFEGNGHTAYGRSNSCIGDAVDAYLVDGIVPEDGLTC